METTEFQKFGKASDSIVQGKSRQEQKGDHLHPGACELGRRSEISEFLIKGVVQNIRCFVGQARRPFPETEHCIASGKPQKGQVVMDIGPDGQTSVFIEIEPAVSIQKPTLFRQEPFF